MLKNAKLEKIIVKNAIKTKPNALHAILDLVKLKESAKNVKKDVQFVKIKKIMAAQDAKNNFTFIKDNVENVHMAVKFV